MKSTFVLSALAAFASANTSIPSSIDIASLQDKVIEDLKPAIQQQLSQAIEARMIEANSQLNNNEFQTL